MNNKQQSYQELACRLLLEAENRKDTMGMLIAMAALQYSLGQQTKKVLSS